MEEDMKHVFAALLIVLLAAGSVNSVLAAPASIIPTFTITEVDRNNTVTIVTHNFPAHDTFKVKMHYYGTLGVGGVVVGSQNTGSGGSFTATYSIPSTYQGLDRIAIRLQSSSSGYYAYNWFWNFDHPDSGSSAATSTPGPTPTSGPTATPGGAGSPSYGYYPTFTITGVDRNNTVTIKGKNFTTNDTYTVYMNYYGTLGIAGLVAGSQSTGSSGSFTATYTIPATFHGLDRIAIRLKSDTTPYYSYNWFWNFNY